MAAIAGELQILQRASRIPAADLLLRIWGGAMGWLFGCFGGGRSRRERLPRICSRSGAHHKNRGRHSKSAALGSSVQGSGRSLLDAPAKKGQFPIAAVDGLRRLPASPVAAGDGLRRLSVLDSSKHVHREAEPRLLKDELSHGLDLRHAPATTTKSWTDLSVSSLRFENSQKRSPSPSRVQSLESTSSGVSLIQEKLCSRAESSSAASLRNYANASTSDKLSCTSITVSTPPETLVSTRASPTREKFDTPIYDEIPLHDESPRLHREPELSPEAVAPQQQLKHQHESALTTLQHQPAQNNAGSEEVKLAPAITLNLPKLLPNTGGFFMFPRKRSHGHRSFMWQEPLSPVAESESSLSSDDEGRQPRKVPALEPAEENATADSSYVSPQRQKDSPQHQKDETPNPSPKSESSEGDLTPVQCVSPTLGQKKYAGKENSMAAATGKREDRKLEDAESVLTPVGNLMQWKQIKEKAFELQLKSVAAKTPASATITVSSDEILEESPGMEDGEVESSFFQEVLQGCSAIETTPKAAASRWNLWDGQGIPNTTSKYKEDQQVLWHSTPFEVRLDKALANHRIEVQQPR